MEIDKDDNNGGSNLKAAAEAAEKLIEDGDVDMNAPKDSTLRRNHPLFALLNRKNNRPNLNIVTNPHGASQDGLPPPPASNGNIPPHHGRAPSLFEEIANNITQNLSGLLPDFFKKDTPSPHPAATPPPKQPQSPMMKSEGAGAGAAGGGSPPRLVLKFATLVDGYDQPSFVVREEGCTIGRGTQNGICIPTDQAMGEGPHAAVRWGRPENALRGGLGREEGAGAAAAGAAGAAAAATAEEEEEDGEPGFHLHDLGQPLGAAVQIGKGIEDREWPLIVNSAFSAGNSVLVVESADLNGDEPMIWLRIEEGPLKGERRKITKEGAALGRATENALSIPDRELSRRHSLIVHDPRRRQFYLCDVGSTNGTYMQLVGPYGRPYRLSLQDNVLVGRTCFSVNRFDYGLSEEIGMRRTMEDRYTLEQDLGLAVAGAAGAHSGGDSAGVGGSSALGGGAAGRGGLRALGLWPQTFAAVYDGHGGPQASTYLWEHLHLAVAAALGAAAARLVEAATGGGGGGGKGGGGGGGPGWAKGRRSLLPRAAAADPDAQAAYSRVVHEAIKSAYRDCDAAFLRESEHPQAGSTAAAALVLGKKLYMINVGDSRALLCRNGQLFAATVDHKPFREDEEARIKAAGGFVVHKRVMGELAVSRAFGDSEFKRGLFTNTDKDTSNNGVLITCEPEILEYDLTPEDHFILLACDGLFDVFENEEAVALVLQEMAGHRNAHRACEALSRRALERGSRDNITVVLLVLNEWW